MDKLTIEQKAKAYDEAIKIAREYWKTDNDNTLDIKAKGTMEYLFPELRESEDEKIRKAIISFLKRRMEVDSSIPAAISSWIAWLEKQGKDNYYNKELSELLHKVICRFINDPDIPYSDREKVSVKVLPYVELLEKRGEQKSIIEMKSAEESLGIDSEIYNEIVDECIYGEQKNNDKVKPKFHEGDIIKPKDGGHEPWQIMQVDMFNKRYRFKDGYIIHFSHENDYELVEQKPIEKAEPKSDFELSLKHIMEEAIECGDTHNLKADAEMLYNIAQKSAKWSEEDSYMLEQAIKCVNNSGKLDVSTEEIEDWLKSLKPQLKQEWSEEDERIRQCLIRDQEEALDDVRNDKYGHSEIVSDLKEMYRERIDWLKSLRPQNTWKPSKEQMKALAEALSLAKNCGEESAFNLRTLYEQLKECII